MDAQEDQTDRSHAPFWKAINQIMRAVITEKNAAARFREVQIVHLEFVETRDSLII